MKLTKLERNWVMYDVGNSALVLFNTAITPIYFNAINTGASSAELLTSWSNAQTISSLVVALLMPILGSLADYAGYKIKFFTGFFLTGFILCLAEAIPMGAMAFTVIYVVCTVGLNSSMTFYDSMLTDITTDDRMDDVSSMGFAMGYIGSTIPFIVCILLIMVGPSVIGIDQMLAIRISYVITAIWWLAFTIPLLRTYKQKFGKEREPGETIGRIAADSFKGLWATLKDIAKDKQLLLFIIAYFCYIDGVHTVISLSTSYGSALGIDSTQLVLALLVTQFVAFPASIAYGRLAGKFGTLKMIIVAVAAYMGIVLFAAFFLETAVEFWILAILVGLFQGGVQALSRSYFGKLIPKERSNEYYGFFDIFGKYAAVLGTTLVSVVTTLTGNASLGVLSIGILIVVGLVLLLVLSHMQAKEAKAAAAE